MKPAPRTLRLLAAAAAFAGVCVAPARPRTNQPPPARRGDAVQRAKGARAVKDSKRAPARVRQLAVAALLEAAEAARSVEHAGDRVSLQADAADALWPLDEPAARSVLRRAWEFTTDPNALAAFRPEEEGARFGARARIIIARQHIILRAARHDPKLAESYMLELDRGLPADEEEEPTGATADGRGGSPRGMSLFNRRKLWTAHRLLEQGSYESAVALAAPVVSDGVNPEILYFLMELRGFAPREADALYLRLLAVTRADARSNAADVMLLSTPVVSPELILFITPDGSPHLRTLGRRPDGPPVPTQVRRAFYDTAAAVLLRPAADGASQAPASFFAIGRLLPFFEREAPQHAAPLRARLATLAQDIDESRRAALSSQMDLETLTPRNPPDPLQAQLDALGRASDDAGRDRARFDAASAAALRKLWERARKFASEIVDAKTRRAAFQFITLEQVKDVGEGFADGDAPDDFERAASFARAAEAPASLRAYGLAQAAELAARKGKKQRASELFDEAEAQAASVDRGTAAHVALLSLLTERAARVDAARAWGLLTALTAAVNELEGRPVSEESEPECAGVSVETSENSYCVELAEPLPEPEEVFGALARLDLGRALKEARALKGPYTRAGALLHAARAATAGAGRGGRAAR